MPFAVPDLSYGYEALEPYIDAETMKIHHDKHHGAYVANLNKALDGSEYASWPVEALVRDYGRLPDPLKTPVRNNAGGHLNHSIFWSTLGPSGNSRPSGSLASAIDRDLGGFEALKEALTKAALARFGSGWAWLGLEAKKLLVLSTPNQDSPLTEGIAPLFGIDVWEHAYYLRYQNRRADYVEGLFKVIDWKSVGGRFERAML